TCFRAAQVKQPFGLGCRLDRIGVDPPPAFNHQAVRAELSLVVDLMALFPHSEQLISNLITTEGSPLVGLEEIHGLTRSPPPQERIGGQVRDIADWAGWGVGDHLAEFRLNLLVLPRGQSGLSSSLHNRAIPIRLAVVHEAGKALPGLKNIRGDRVLLSPLEVVPDPTVGQVYGRHGAVSP